MIESIVISKVFGQPLFTISGVKSGGESVRWKMT
jgi:hypothetical protein